MKIIKTSAYEQLQMFNPEDYPGKLKPLFDPNSIPDKPEISNNLLEDLDSLGSMKGYNIERLLNEHGIEWEKITLKNVLFYVFDYLNQRYIAEQDGSYNEVSDWLSSVYDPFDYLDQKDFSKEFWEEVSENYVLYHGTTKENAEKIKRKGLTQKDNTRGIANRGTGAAVFATSNYETANTYTYPDGVVLEILIGKMKKSGYTPFVAQEGPIEEAEAYETLAHKLGIEDYSHEVESGIEMDTVVIYGNIPPQFIRFP